MTTWNPADLSSYVLLTNNNWDATAESNNPIGVRSTDSRAAGKLYAEFTYRTATGANTGIGISVAGADFAQLATATAANGCMVYVTGAIAFNGVASSYNIGQAILPQDIICVALDLDKKLAWFRFRGGPWQGDPTADPVAGVNGIDISALFPAQPAFLTATFTAGHDEVFANFGHYQFSYAVPLGFGAWAPPITSIQSFTWVLREVFLGTLTALPFFSPFSVRRTPSMPIQVNQLPMLGIYILDETMSPDGDANAGEIRFVHTFRIGFQAIIQNNDPDAAEQKLDSIFWAMMNGLWRNESITNRLNTATWHHQQGTPDNTRFEAITRGIRRHRFGATGQNNETPIAELQYDISCTYRADYPPLVTDDFLTLHLQTAFPVGGTQSDQAAVQQVVVEYDFPEDANEQ